MTSTRSPESALVLGASGFVGINLADALRAAGHRVVGSYRARVTPFFLRARVDETVRADLADRGALRAAMRGRSAVFHAAGHYPRYSLDRDASVQTALTEMRNVLEVAQEMGVRRVVYTSSIATLERREGRAADEDAMEHHCPADSVYRAVKWHMECAALDARHEGLDVIILRPGGCLGPWDMRAGTGALVIAVIRKMLTWRVDGFVHLVDVRDVARAHVAALRAPAHGCYNLAGHGVTVASLLRRIAARYGGEVPEEALGPEAARARAEADEREAAPSRSRVTIPREMVDIALCGGAVTDAHARRELGFNPRALDEALDASVTWFRRTGHLPRVSSEIPIPDAEGSAR